jgi:hypothetical protein
MFAASKSAKAAAAAVTTDPSFAYVPLLLNTTSTNGQQNNTFLDSSTNNFTITRNGTPTQGSRTPYWPNGQWSNYFSVATNYINVAASASLASNTSSFTLEFWYNSTATGNGRPAGSGGSGFVANTWICASNNTAGKLEFFVVNYSAVSPMFSSTSSTVASDGAWHHIVLVRSTNTWAMFIDGTRQGSSVTSSVSFNGTSSGLYIGYSGLTGETANAFSGYISNFRFVNGSAQYDPTQTTITVPTSPLTSVTNTQILTCYSNRFIDTNTQVAAKTITVNGTPTVQAFQPFSPTASYTTAAYGGSGYFNGSTDYVSAPNATALQLNSSLWTIEGWFYVTAGTGTDRYLLVQANGSADANVNWLLRIKTTNVFRILLLLNGGAANAFVDGTTTVNLNTWYYIAATCDGTGASANLRLWVNGNYEGGTTFNSSQVNTNTASTRVMAWPDVPTYTSGYASNVRVIKGTALYTGTGAITVPTSPVTAVTNTSLLLNMTNAGIYDAAVQNNLITVGDAQASTTITAKWPPTSIKFDGTGDYLTLPVNSADTFGSGNWTIEGWFYFSSVSGFPEIFSKESLSSDGIRCVLVSSKVNLSLSSNGTAYATTVVGGTTIATGTWYYLAFTRSANTITIYLNGTSDGTGTFTGALYETNTFWSLASRGGAGTLFNGYIQDFRVTKGIARTIATPTAAFPTR